MAFTDEQRQALNAKLRYRHVKMRSSNGAQLAYVEGWHAISEANRIFGYESWDRQTLAPRCVWQEKQRGETACIYSTKVRITVRAGETAIVREGVGTGIGRSTSAETAHDIALKAAETDATKRALATFGNPFGLALYDKDKRGVTKQQRRRGRPKTTHRLLPPPLRLVLHEVNGKTHSYDSVIDFITAALRCVEDLQTHAAVYAFWEANLDGLSVASRAGVINGEDPARVIGAALKARLHALDTRSESSSPTSEAPETADSNAPLEPSTSEQEPPAATAHDGELLLPKDKRIRDQAHLAFVAGQPCLVCGRRPAQAHHIRFAQRGAFGLKVSDEFTVPLCNSHHQSLHQTGDERAWWARHGIIDPVTLANRLWAISHQRRQAPPTKLAMSFDDEFDDVANRPTTQRPNGSNRG